ncbi:MAG TPA: hypothetical protein VGL08_07550 [Paraburkholderia sp.]
MAIDDTFAPTITSLGASDAGSLGMVRRADAVIRHQLTDDQICSRDELHEKAIRQSAIHRHVRTACEAAPVATMTRLSVSGGTIFRCAAA